VPAQVGVVATGRKSPAHDFSVAINIVRFYELQSWIRWNCGVQIDDRAMVPNDSAANGAIAGERLPNDVSTGVDRVRDAEAVALKVPRSLICPFLQRVAWKDWPPSAKDPPTASPASLSQIACEKLPSGPSSVPRSVKEP